MDDIVSRLIEIGAPRVVITGGEPLLHQNRPAWPALLDWVHSLGMAIEIETNGTQAPAGDTITHATQFNVSPKLAHAGDPEAMRVRPAALRALLSTARASFKFVARTVNDLDEVAHLTASVGIPDHLVWIMPEGTTAAGITARTAELADAVVARHWNLTTRLHVLAWGDERGR